MSSYMTFNKGTMQNGLNFNKSVNDINSRLVRFLSFLMLNGLSTKRTVLDKVFNKKGFSTSWGCYMFTLARYNGYVETKRVGRMTYWLITDEGCKILEGVTK